MGLKFNPFTGTFDFDSGASGGGSVAGSNTQVQFNDSGAFGADSGLTYNKTSDKLTIGNTSGSLDIIHPGGSANPNTTNGALNLKFNTFGGFTYINGIYSGALVGSIAFYYSGATVVSGNIIYFSPTGNMNSYAAMTASQFSHYQAGYFGTRMTAGQFVYSGGGFGAKHQRLVTTGLYELTKLYTYVDVDAANSNYCSGTPSDSCASHLTEATCEENNAHNGCEWTPFDCSTLDETDEATCEAQNGCTYLTENCNTIGTITPCQAETGCVWNDCTAQTNQVDCEAVNLCSWNFSNCTDFNDSYSGCGGASGCTWSAAVDCALNDGTDQGTCEADAGCVWNSGNNTCEGSCSGQYNTSCTGDNCEGTFFTGVCDGAGAGDCDGTPTCIDFDNSTSCGDEPGCTWSTGAALKFPVETDASDFMTYFIRNIAASDSVILYPNTGQTVNGTTTLTIAAAKARHASLAFFEGDCTEFTGTDQTTCETGHTGCVWSDPDCTGTWTRQKDWSIYGGVF